jgi:hypothetical protein
MNETDVIEREPYLLRNGKPRLIVCERRPHPADAWTFARERLHEVVAAKAFAFVRYEHHRMTALREIADDRLEDAQVREVQRCEKNFHFRAITRRFFP